MGEAASDRRLVALRLDPRPEDLEFEEAARLRDQIETLKRVELGLPAARAG